MECARSAGTDQVEVLYDGAARVHVHLDIVHVVLDKRYQTSEHVRLTVDYLINGQFLLDKGINRSTSLANKWSISTRLVRNYRSGVPTILLNSTQGWLM